MADATLDAESLDPMLQRTQKRQQRMEVIRVFLLIIAFVVIGNILGAVYGQKMLRLYKEQLHLSVNTLGTIGIIVGIPAYLQPFMGAWSDLFPLFGYRRRSYLVLAAIIEALGFWGLYSLHHYQLVTVICLVIVVASGGMIMGVIVNAVMVSVGNPTGTFGSMQSVLQFVPIVMMLAYTAHLRGYVAQFWTFQHCFWVALVLCLLRAPFALLIHEQRVTGSKQTPEERAAHLETRREEQARVRAALRAATASPGLWAIVGFVFYLILTPGINNAIYYYQKDVIHLSDQFIGDLGRWGGLGTVIGLIVFMFGSRFLPVRSLVWGAWLMDCATYPALVFMHDAPSAKWVTLLSALIGVLYGLCLYTLAARACPPGIEGTVYGMVLAAIALGGTLSEKIGAWLYDFFGPPNLAHHYSLTHGWYWSLGVGFVFTVLAVVFIPFLPAWARSNQPLRAFRGEANV